MLTKVEKKKSQPESFHMHTQEGKTTEVFVEILKYDISTGKVIDISHDRFGTDGDRRMLSKNSTAFYEFDDELESLHIVVKGLKKGATFKALVQNPHGAKSEKSLLVIVLIFQIFILIGCLVGVPIALLVTKYYQQKLGQSRDEKDQVVVGGPAQLPDNSNMLDSARIPKADLVYNPEDN